MRLTYSPLNHGSCGRHPCRRFQLVRVHVGHECWGYCDTRSMHVQSLPPNDPPCKASARPIHLDPFWHDGASIPGVGRAERQRCQYRARTCTARHHRDWWLGANNPGGVEVDTIRTTTSPTAICSTMHWHCSTHDQAHCTALHCTALHCKRS